MKWQYFGIWTVKSRVYMYYMWGNLRWVICRTCLKNKKRSWKFVQCLWILVWTVSRALKNQDKKRECSARQWQEPLPGAATKRHAALEVSVIVFPMFPTVAVTTAASAALPTQTGSFTLLFVATENWLLPHCLHRLVALRCCLWPQTTDFCRNAYTDW